MSHDGSCREARGERREQSLHEVTQSREAEETWGWKTRPKGCRKQDAGDLESRMEGQFGHCSYFFLVT